MAKFGRLRCSIQLSNLLLKLHKYNHHEEMGDFNLEYWEVTDWKEFVGELEELRSALIRKDADTFITVPVIDSYENSEIVDNDCVDVNDLDLKNLEDDEINETIASNILFTDKFEDILDMCYLHWALSYIRVDIEGAVNTPKGTHLGVTDDEVEDL